MHDRGNPTEGSLPTDYFKIIYVCQCPISNSVLGEKMTVFNRKNSFAIVVKFFNKIGLALSSSLDLNV